MQGFCVRDIRVLVYVHMYKCVRVYGGQRLMLSIILHHSVPILLRLGLSWKLGLSNWTRLAVQ